jgi:outer membrane protein
MHPIFRVLAPVAMLLALAAPATAQKLAFVASEEILNRLPEVKDARARLGELQSNWMREIQRQEGDISQLRTQIETNRLLWSVQERRDAEGRLKELESRLTTFRSDRYDSGGEYEKAHQELMSPLYRRVFEAIAEEAKAQRIDFVFDKSSRGMPMLYANADYDLTPQVLTRLGLKLDASELLPAGAPLDDAVEGGASPRRGRRDPAAPPPSGDPNEVLIDKNGRIEAR